MAVNLDNMLYKRTWNDCHVDYYEGYRSQMVDFHAHDYYEISLILSGYVKVFVSDHVQEGTESCIVLSSPKTPHFIYRDPDSFYSRINLLFSHEFLADYVPEWEQLRTVFGSSGRVLSLSPEQAAFSKQKMLEIQAEPEPFRKRLLILCLLSHLSELFGKDATVLSEIPHYVTGALTYIGEHYAEKILAETLAWHLGVGRTTLMTAFKKYTGSTLGDYLMRCRVKNATRMLRAGVTEQDAAEACGFGNACSLIRAFKRCYNMTPKLYLAAEKVGHTANIN
ncbi:MAG: helix-turn-helix transcriptional regulator [Clostridia bacterium]|nr:helix-turn-helix transcriptional regulator [Clostridia bacterium]